MKALGTVRNGKDKNGNSQERERERSETGTGTKELQYIQLKLNCDKIILIYNQILI